MQASIDCCGTLHSSDAGCLLSTKSLVDEERSINAHVVWVDGRSRSASSAAFDGFDELTYDDDLQLVADWPSSSVS